MYISEGRGKPHYFAAFFNYFSSLIVTNYTHLDKIMTEKRSKASLKREEIRKSPKTLQFKREITEFLEDKSSILNYAIKRDLACMTNMPFYKDRPEKIKIELTHRELLVEYMKAFVKHEDKEFVIKLIKALNKNQAQTIRKVAPKIGAKSEVWEHTIPAAVIVNALIDMIENEDISDLDKLLDVYETAGQRGITKEQDSLLAEMKSTMPENWDWQDEDVNPLMRHEVVGIFHE